MGIGETDPQVINWVINTALTAYDFIDRHQMAIAVLVVAACLALICRALRRASRYIDDLADEQQQTADLAAADTWKEKP